MLVHQRKTMQLHNIEIHHAHAVCLTRSYIIQNYLQFNIFWCACDGDILINKYTLHLKMNNGRYFGSVGK